MLKDGHRDALNKMGSKSGRDMDKMHESGLTPVFVEGQPTFEEAELVLICRKRGVTDIAPDDMAQEVQDKVVRRSRLPHHVYRRDRSPTRTKFCKPFCKPDFYKYFTNSLTESVYDLSK